MIESKVSSAKLVGDSFEVKPSLVSATFFVVLEFVLILLILSTAFFLITFFSEIDYSFIYEYASKQTIFATFFISFAAVFILVLFLKISSILNTRLIFMTEGFEYWSGFLFKSKKIIFYADVIRINYKKSIFDGDLILELSGTDVVNIEIQHVMYPQAVTSKIKKIIDDSVSLSLFNKLKMADKTIEEDTAEKIVELVRYKNLTKDNVADQLANAANGEKLSKNIYGVILAQLIHSGKIKKSDLSSVLFSMFQKDLISKKEIADVLFYLNSI